ncbi:MAG: hypothetical protein ACK56I_31435 [bacterium]
MKPDARRRRRPCQAPGIGIVSRFGGCVRAMAAEGLRLACARLRYHARP